MKSLLDRDAFERRLPPQMLTHRVRTLCQVLCAVVFRVVARFLAVFLLFWSPNVVGSASIAKSLDRPYDASVFAGPGAAEPPPSVSAPDFWDDQDLCDPCEDAEEKVEADLAEERNQSIPPYFALLSSFSDVPVGDSTGRHRYRRDRARGPPVI